MKNHMGKYSNTLAYRKCYLKLILSIGFRFWEPLRPSVRGALHYHNFYLFYFDPLSKHILKCKAGVPLKKNHHTNSMVRF